jgi:hypothetical protein
LVANDNFSSSVYVSPQNWQGETKFMANFRKSWSLLWKQKNEEFEAFLKAKCQLVIFIWKGFVCLGQQP